MGMQVSYDICDDTTKKAPHKIRRAACFAGLAGILHGMKDTAYVLFYVEKICTQEEVEWYALGLNMIGLDCSMRVGPKSYHFYVCKTKPFPRMLATLTAIRYLQESNYPKMIKWGFKHAKENPQLGFFEIFQLMHFSLEGGVLNTGHAFMGGLSPYGNVHKLVTQEEFIKKLLKAGSVNSTMIPENNAMLTTAEKSKIKKYIKNGEFSEIFNFAVATPKKVVEV